VHRGWYHGHWHGHWQHGSAYWYANPWRNWGFTAGAVGLTAWMTGSLFYNTGYYAYVNPYYVATPVVVQYPVLNYSVPIQTTAAPPAENSPVEQAAITASDQARTAFSRGNYAQALDQIDVALAQTPGDAVLHEFRALTLFAMKRYKEAAATLYAVLSVGPGWDWTTMIGLYPNEDVYSAQLRALEAYVRANPNAADGHFVLAYQYMTVGHPQEAAEQYQDVLQLVPNDSVSRQMLALLTSTADQQAADQQASEQPANAPPPGPSGPAVARGDILGRWTAPSPADGTVDLSLDNDGRFAWRFSQANNTQSFAGKFELAGNTLVLEYDNGGTMVAKVAPSPNGFTFQMVGGPPNDPGLAFARTR
jgi:tetratricopeptide (TPR) repeat protein